ncbi:hypothetical protein KI387_022635, partial [Taxus chinensis]
MVKVLDAAPWMFGRTALASEAMEARGIISSNQGIAHLDISAGSSSGILGGRSPYWHSSFNGRANLLGTYNKSQKQA